MATEHFCLRWNNHQSTLVSVFDNLLESGTLVDCTLAADGRYLKAHKVVLSACSPYLGMLLSQHHDKHPIIILKDVKFEELKAMLDYMYRGEVNISQEQLTTFLKAAESLQIKGLTDTGGEEGLQPIRPPSSNSTVSVNNEEPPSPVDGGSPSRKRRRNRTVDEMPDCETKLTITEGVANVTKTSVGVKREPADTDGGDGQMNVDESGEVTSAMLSRPGPSNGGSTNNKGSPWPDNAEEMQLTPGQDGEIQKLKGNIKEEIVPSENLVKKVPEIKEEIFVDTKVKEEILDDSYNCGFENTSVDPFQDSSQTDQASQSLGSVTHQTIILNNHYQQEEMIVPDVLNEEEHRKMPQEVKPSKGRQRLKSIPTEVTPPSKTIKASLRSSSKPLSDKKTNPTPVTCENSSVKKSYDLSDIYECTKDPSFLVKKKRLEFVKKFRKILPAKPVDRKELSEGTIHQAETKTRGEIVSDTILNVPCKPRDKKVDSQSHFVPASTVGLHLKSSSVSNLTLPTQSHFAITTSQISQQITTSPANQIMNQFQISSPNVIQSSQDLSQRTHIMNQFQISSPNVIQSPQNTGIIFKNIDHGVLGPLGGMFANPSTAQYSCPQMIAQSTSSASQTLQNSLILDSQNSTTQISSVMQEVLKLSNFPTSSQLQTIVSKPSQVISKPVVKGGRAKYEVSRLPSRPVKILPKPDTE